MIKNFHQEQEKKLEAQLERENPLEREDELDRVNRFYNND